VAGVTAVLRVVRLVGVLLGGALLVPVLAVLRGTARAALVRALARAALAALGVRVTVRGGTPRPGSLLVANHVSWLDVVVLLAAAPARLVAKREVRGYPAVGALAAAAGTIFLDRSQPRHLPRLVAEVAAALRAGTSVAVFPEGTTYCGAVGGRWRPAMFQAAIDARVPVVPLRVAYLASAGSPGCAG
jgi:1-acyl-sn-glycerol-3-phosphate acyltransferase